MNSSVSSLSVTLVKSTNSRARSPWAVGQDSQAFNDLIMRRVEPFPKRSRCKPICQGIVRRLIVTSPKKEQRPIHSRNILRQRSFPEGITFYDKKLGMEQTQRANYCSLSQAKSQHQYRIDSNVKPFLPTKYAASRVKTVQPQNLLHIEKVAVISAMTYTSRPMTVRIARLHRPEKMQKSLMSTAQLTPNHPKSKQKVSVPFFKRKHQPVKIIVHDPITGWETIQ